ncbi:MAG: hypothetical protein WA709_33105 [Stellaceae bacterium]
MKAKTEAKPVCHPTHDQLGPGILAPHTRHQRASLAGGERAETSPLSHRARQLAQWEPLSADSER